MARSTTITREQARQLHATNEFVPVPGFVKVPGGFVSTHEAFTRTLADPDFPQKNALAVAKEQYDLEAPQRAGIAAAEAAVRAENEQRRKAAEANAKAFRAQEARNKAAYAKSQGVNLV